MFGVLRFDLEFLCTAKGVNPAFTFDLAAHWA
jgi:hypothetical protein